MKKLFILGAGILQVPVIRRAREMGFFTVVVDGSCLAPGLVLADKSYVADILDKDQMLKIAEDEKVTGVIHPCSEVAMDVMGYINDRLELCGISEEMARKATNKALMRKAFADYGASGPRSVETFSEDEAWNFFSLYRKTAILKPSRNSGSRGIAKISSSIEKREFSKAYNEALNQSRDRSVLLEDFITGPEFSIEGVIFNGRINILTITDKVTTGAPHFVELGHSQPTLLPVKDQSVVLSSVVDGARALNLDNCAIHAEVKLQDGVAYIMEIGARLGGDFITTDLTPLSTGVDMVAAAINISMGIEPDLKPKHTAQGACVKYFTPGPGVVRAIEGDLSEEVLKGKACGWLQQLEIYPKVGDRVNDICSSSDRSGHVITTGNDALEAIRRAELILGLVRIVTEMG